MELTFEQIRSVATGFVSYEVADGKLYFQKCTKKQIDFWYNEVSWLGERAETTTGIRLDFTTDSKRFCAKVSPHRFEVRVNGVIVAKTESGTLDIRLSGKGDRVTVILPSHSRGFIESVTLDDGSAFAPRSYNTKLLFMGDSITQGYNSQYDGLSYAHRVTDFFDAESLINGIGGSYFAPGSFDTSDFEPDAVIVAYGCNDLGHYKTMDERKDRADGFLKLVSEAYAGKRLFYIVPIPRRDVDGEKKEEFLAMREAFADIAGGYGFTVIDGFGAVADIGDFYADALHPNDLGFSTYADCVIKNIMEIK